MSPPLEWSESTNLVWKKEIGGLGWSSPSVVKGRIYLTTAESAGDGVSLRALCLSADTGEIVWNREIRQVPKSPGIHAKNSHASPTAIVARDAVFVHFGPLGMARLSASDGTILWRCEELDYPPVHGSGGSPVLMDNKLVVVCDGRTDPFVAAVNAETGKVAWKTIRSIKPKISHSFVTPKVVKVDGKLQVLAPGPDHFASYDLETGAELWRVRAPGWSVVPQPVIAGDLVIYNHDYDHPELIAVKMSGARGDVTDTNVVWRLTKGAPSTPTPVLVGDDLFFVSDKGIASCVEAQTGKTHWMERLPATTLLRLFMSTAGFCFLTRPASPVGWMRVEPSRSSARTS